MKVLLWGTLIVSVTFLIHLVIWKVRLPKRQVKSIFYIFFSALPISLFILWQFPIHISFLQLDSPKSFTEFCHIALFVGSLTITYIIFYPVLEADAPSLIIIKNIANTGSKGIDENDLYKLLNDDVLVIPRINDLVLDKMAYLDGDKYRLTEKGKWMARFFIFHRNFMNINYKGG